MAMIAWVFWGAFDADWGVEYSLNALTALAAFVFACK